MVPALLIVTALALVVGRLTGGAVSGLATVHPRATPLVFTGLLILVVAPLWHPSDAVRRSLVIASSALVLAFLAVNLSSTAGWLRVGVLLLVAGWLSNTLVIAVNDGMPLSLHAYETSGQTVEPTPGEQGFFKLVIAGEETRLRWLGDVIPVRPLRQVFSLGDLILLLGFAVVLVAGTHQAPTRLASSEHAR